MYVHADVLEVALGPRCSGCGRCAVMRHGGNPVPCCFLFSFSVVFFCENAKFFFCTGGRAEFQQAMAEEWIAHSRV